MLNFSSQINHPCEGLKCARDLLAIQLMVGSKLPHGQNLRKDFSRPYTAWRVWKVPGDKVAWTMYRWSSMYLMFIFLALMLDAVS
jgi:hypothetical protein